MQIWLLLASLPGLAALLWAYIAFRRAARSFEEVWRALQPLADEQSVIETRRLELESELDARIKRLLARETYWRGVANSPELVGRRSDAGVTETVSPGSVQSVSSGESPLSLRERLGRRYG